MKSVKKIAIIMVVISVAIAIIENHSAVSYIAKAIMEAPYSLPVVALGIAGGSIITLSILEIINLFPSKKEKSKNDSTAASRGTLTVMRGNERQSIQDLARQIDMPMDLRKGS